jgi:predicted nuclease of predicted toxin-antitoxin system
VRVLLDKCLPKRLKRVLVGHDVKTAPEMGWASKTNGELLALAAGDFDVFVTSDRNLSYQQNVSASMSR